MQRWLYLVLFMASTILFVPVPYFDRFDLVAPFACALFQLAMKGDVTLGAGAAPGFDLRTGIFVLTYVVLFFFCGWASFHRLLRVPSSRRLAVQSGVILTVFFLSYLPVIGQWTNPFGDGVPLDFRHSASWMFT